jgi:hypothetical protein
MENIKVLKVGSGDYSIDIYLSLDLMPIHLIINYDLVKYGSPGFEFFSDPEYIDKIYHIEFYQKVVDMLCEKLKIEKRTVFTDRGNPPIFNFKKDEYFYEFQYYGNFGRTYYTESKLRNALKFYDQYTSVLGADYNLDMFRHFNNLEKSLIKQKVFTNRDYVTLSKSTTDRFINSLISSCKN